MFCFYLLDLTVKVFKKNEYLKIDNVVFNFSSIGFRRWEESWDSLFRLEGFSFVCIVRSEWLGEYGRSLVSW